MFDGLEISSGDLNSFFLVIGTILVMNSGRILDFAAKAIKAHFERKAAQREAFRQIGMLLTRVHQLEEKQNERIFFMKSFAAHYSNKHPGGSVDYDETKLTAYDYKGRKRVAIAIGGNGEIVDRSEEVGALDRHDMSPIPKNARASKLYADGRLAPAEEYQERIVAAKDIAIDGKVLSIEEYKKLTSDFDVNGDVVTKKQKS